MTTIINGDGWYLFGIAKEGKIAKLVKAGDNKDDNFLNDHIVKNHSATVDTAYIVDKHNPVSGWITKSVSDDVTTYTANTNMSGATYYQWFNKDDGQIADEVEATSSHVNANRVVITNHSPPPAGSAAGTLGPVKEKIIATYADVVITGSKKNDTETADSYNTQASWAFEPNTILEAIVNKSGEHTYQWKITNNETGTITSVNDQSPAGEPNKFIVSGPNIGNTISVTVTTGDDSVNTVTATYDTSIGASISPFKSDNWKKIIYDAPTLDAINTTNDEYYNGVSEWTNSTGITLGIWVKITGFADTVPPKLAEEDSDNPKTIRRVEDETDVNGDPVQTNASTVKKQTITIPFTKNLVLDDNPNLSDFTIRITDNRDNTDATKKTCDPTIFPKQDIRTINPESVTVSGKNLILTLPHFVPVGNGGNKPQVYNTTNGTGFSNATDKVEVQYVRTLVPTPHDADDGTTTYTHTMLTDDSLYPNPGGVNYYGTNAGRTYGNLLPNFGYGDSDSQTTTSQSSTAYSVGHDIDWNGELTNDVSQDNTAPTVTGITVSTNGKDIVLTFSENIADLPSGTTEFTGFEVRYTDRRSAFQKNSSRGGVTGTTFNPSGQWGSNANQLESEGSSLTPAITSVVVDASNTTVTTTAAHALALNDVVVIEGITGAGDGLNGTRTVIAVGNNTFSFALVSGVSTGTYNNTGITYFIGTEISWTDAYFTATKTAAKEITITLSDASVDQNDEKYTNEGSTGKRRIYKTHNDAEHIVTVSYNGSDANLTQDVTDLTGAFYANKVQAFSNFPVTNSSDLNDTYPTISIGSFIDITTETNKGTDITNSFSFQGPSGRSGQTWTLVECDVNGIAVTADTKNGAVTDNFVLTSPISTSNIKSASTSTNLKLKWRPNFSYADDNTRANASSGGWKTETKGIQSNTTYYFRLVATIKGSRDGGTTNNENFITYSPILIYNDTPGSSTTTDGNHIKYTDVKTQLTRKLIAANQVIRESKLVIFFDNESGELAIGPTNNLEDTKSETTPKARNDYANGFISITLGFGIKDQDWTSSSTNGSHFLGASLSKQGTTWTNTQKDENVTAEQTPDMALFYAENGEAATTGQDGATTDAGFAHGNTREESLASPEALGARMTDSFDAASGGSFGSYFLKGQGKYTEKNNNSGTATSLKQYANNAHQRVFQNTSDGWATKPYFNVGTLLAKNLAWIWNSAGGAMFNPTVKNKNDKGTYDGDLNSNIGWYEDKDNNYFMQLNYSRFGHFKLKSNLLPAGHGVKNTFLGIDTQMKNTDSSAVAEPFNPTKTTTHDYVTVTHTLS